MQSVSRYPVDSTTARVAIRYASASGPGRAWERTDGKRAADYHACCISGHRSKGYVDENGNLSADGIVGVNNEIRIELASVNGAAERDAEKHEGDRSFVKWVDDATTTAAVKSRLVRNDNTEGLQINVDTRGDVVTLSGRVASAQEKQLAEELARNSGDVREVRNQLVVDPNVRWREFSLQHFQGHCTGDKYGS